MSASLLSFDLIRSGDGGPCLCHNLRRASRSISRFYDQNLAGTGLRTTQFSILMVLDRHSPLSMNALAEALVTERTTLTRNIAVLEKAGLVQTQSGEDKRQRNVSLSPAGQAALQAALPAWRSAQMTLVERFGEARLTRMLDGLSELVAFTRGELKEP